MDVAGDARGHRIIFDAGELRGVAQGCWEQAEEQTRAHARLQHTAACEAKALCEAPERADDRLRGVVGVYSRPLQGGVFGRGHGFGEVPADLLPARAEPGLAGQWKGVLC